MPRISVVLPSPPGRKGLINRSIRSLQEQVLADGLLEIVVAWDGRKPSGWEPPPGVVSVVSPRVKGRETTPHPNHTRNAGTRVATGDFVWVTGSDWLFPPDTIRHVLRELDACSAAGIRAVLTPTMAAIPGSPGAWLERTEAYAKGERDWDDLTLLFGTLSSAVHCGFTRAFRPDFPNSMPLDELGEGMMVFPKALWEVLEGFDERFFGWGGNYEEFNNRIMTLRGEGLLQVRLIRSVRLIHQPHLKASAATQKKKKQPGQALREMKATEIGRRAPWWKKQLAAAQKLLGKGPDVPALTDDPTTTRVVIMTYQRPKLLLRLLNDLQEQAAKAGEPICVQVFDDASRADYSEARAFLDQWGIPYRFTSAAQRHGKHGFHRWVSQAYAAQRAENAERWLFLPDDVRLCDNFFPLANERWSSVAKPVSMLIHVDSSRKTAACWSGIAPSPENEFVEHVGWWDGMGFAGRGFFEALGWKCPPVPRTRWARNPSLGSGVGQVVTQALVAKAKVQMFRTTKSLVVTGLNVSRMNREERRKHPLLTVDFIGPPEELRALQYGAPVIGGMATMPSRLESLELVVNRLEGQLDELHIYLNEHDVLPDFLKGRPWVKAILSKDDPRGDLGDAGKFVAAASAPADAFFLSFDDDILYPANYVSQTIGRIEAYDRKAVVSWHGATFTRGRIRSFCDDRDVFHCLGDVDEDRPTHILGTGVMGFHLGLIRPLLAHFKQRNMADIWMGALGQQGKIPFMALAHHKGWLKLKHGTNVGSIWEGTSHNDRPQTTAVNSLAPWSLFSPTDKAIASPEAEVSEAAEILTPFMPPPDRRSLIAVLGSDSASLVAALGARGYRAIEMKDYDGRTPLAGVMGWRMTPVQLETARRRIKGRPRVALLVTCSRSTKGAPPPIRFQRAFPGTGPRAPRQVNGLKYTLFSGRLPR
ncbi:MAG: hypothetical protein GY871_04550 [Actinomycetales bacterium]|nr:hypothetical protein [Actinomycetales bacterium]